MKFVTAEQGKGKTHWCIRYFLHSEDCILMVPGENDKQIVLQEIDMYLDNQIELEHLRDEKLLSDRIITAMDFVEGNYIHYPKDVELIIDDLPYCLDILMPNVSIASIPIEDISSLVLKLDKYK